MKRNDKLKKAVRENVENEKNFTIAFHMSKEGKMEMIGEKTLLDYLKSKEGGVTVDDLLVRMEELHENKSEGTLEFDEFSVVQFPKLKVKFMSKQWTLPVARDCLRTYMQILGFGRGQLKTYKNPNYKPAGWPDSIAFVTFMPHLVSKSDANEIIESLLKHRGINVYKHHKEAQQPQIDQQITTAVGPEDPHIDSEGQQQQVDQPEQDENYDTSESVQYEAPFPYVQQEPVAQTDQFQYYTNSYENYPNYAHNYDYNYQYYYTAQPESQQPTTNSGEASVNDAIREATSYCQL